MGEVYESLIIEQNIEIYISRSLVLDLLPAQLLLNFLKNSQQVPGTEMCLRLV